MALYQTPSGGHSSLKYVKNTEVTFNFNCRTEFGDKVALVGSIPLLGHWDINKIVYLTTTPD